MRNLMIVLVCLLASPVRAQADLSVAYLEVLCEAPESSGKYALCLGYLTGVADTLAGKAQGQPPVICMPPESTQEDAVTAFRTWAEDLGTMAPHVHMAEGAKQALTAAFPCPKPAKD